MRRAKKIFFYEKDTFAYLLARHYTPDFKIMTSSGKYFYVETKGYFRSEDRAKLIAVKKTNPLIDIRIIFMQDKKIRKSGKMKYSDWAIKYGFMYAFNKVPREWLKE